MSGIVGDPIVTQLHEYYEGVHGSQLDGDPVEPIDESPSPRVVALLTRAVQRHPVPESRGAARHQLRLVGMLLFELRFISFKALQPSVTLS